MVCISVSGKNAGAFLKVNGYDIIALNTRKENGESLFIMFRIPENDNRKLIAPCFPDL